MRKWSKRIMQRLLIVSIVCLSIQYPSPAFALNALTVWVENSATKVYSSSPVPANPRTSIELFSAKNENEAAQIAIRSTHALDNVSVTIHSLTGPDGATIPTGNISVRRVKNMYTLHNSGGEIETPPAPNANEYPDILVDNAPFDLEANVTLAYWYSVYVDSGQAPGTYTGTVVVNTDSGNVPIDVSLVVYDVELPQTASADYLVNNWLTSVGWDFTGTQISVPYQFGVEIFDEDWWTIYENIAKNFKKHRNNVLYVDVLGFLMLGGLDIDAQGHHTFDWTNFDRFIELFIDEGTVKYIWNAHMLDRKDGWEGPSYIKTITRANGVPTLTEVPAGSAEANQWLGVLLPALKSHLDQKGWTEMYYLVGHDEPATVQHISADNWFYDKVDQYVPEARKGEPFYEFRSGLENRLTTFVPQLDVLDQNMAYYTARRAAGKEIWTYTCVGPQGQYPNRFLDYALVKTRLIHWFNWKAGATGFLHYGWNYWNTKPNVLENWQNADGSWDWAPGDTHIVYPDVTDLSVYDSIRHEAQLDGIEDYELLNILSAIKPQLAKKIVDGLMKNGTDYTRDGSDIVHAHKIILDGIVAADSDLTMTTFEDDFSRGNDNSWHHVVGTWSVNSEQYVQSDMTTYNAVSSLKGNAYRDFEFSADVKIPDANGDASNWAGFQIRSHNPGDATTGYLIGIRHNGQLFIHRAGSDLATVSLPVWMAEYNHLKVITSGSTIRVYVNHSLTPALEVTDDLFAVGYLGLRSGGVLAHFDNVKVSVSGVDFFDNFEAGYDTMWTQSYSPWSIVSGAYSENTGNGMSTLTGKTYSNGALAANLRIVNNNGIASNWVGLIVRKTNAADNYLDSGYLVYMRKNGQLAIYKAGAGDLQTYDTGLDPSHPFRLEVVLRDDNLKVYVNHSETAALDITDSAYSSGYISLITGGASGQFDDVQFTR